MKIESENKMLRWFEMNKRMFALVFGLVLLYAVFFVAADLTVKTQSGDLILNPASGTVNVSGGLTLASS